MCAALGAFGYHVNDTSLKIWGPSAEPFALGFGISDRLFGDLVLETYAAPLVAMLTFPGAPWNRLSNFLEYFRSHVASDVNDFRWTFRHSLKMTRAKSSKPKQELSRAYSQSFRAYLLFVCFSHKPCKYGAPEFMKRVD